MARISITPETQEQDPMDFNDKTSAIRMGRRIKEIRTAIGKSQVSLGEDVGVPGARIYKYETGERRPKPDLLKKIASSLGVSTLALTDPVVTNYDGIMYAFFIMEKRYNLKVYRDGKRCTLMFGDGENGMINDYLKEWDEKNRQVETALDSAASEEEKAVIEQEYNMWKWNYPRDLAKQTQNSLSEKWKAERRAELEAKKEQIDKELSELNNSGDE